MRTLRSLALSFCAKVQGETELVRGTIVVPVK